MASMASTPVSRRTSGGPVLQDDVTDAIEAAFFQGLAEVGFGRLSIDAIAKRAGVGKAAIYRRWRSKLDMTIALVPKVAVAATDVPTSTPTPWATLGPELPGMRSRIEPKARAPPVPIACTPGISRHALPAIFCTTPSATDICPSSVAS